MRLWGLPSISPEFMVFWFYFENFTGRNQNLKQIIEITLVKLSSEKQVFAIIL